MVRAATLGKIDFSEFDPWDLWWWRRLKWILHELEEEQHREVIKLRHTHWLTLSTTAKDDPDYLKETESRAFEAMNDYLKAVYPWLADVIAKGGTFDQDAAVAAYRERFGVPGEPRYEAMVSKLREALSKKLTPMEKRRMRWEREQRRQQKDLKH